jgi:hypothetical protein
MQSHPLAVRCDIYTAPGNRRTSAVAWELGNDRLLKWAARSDPDLAALFINASEV